MQPISPSSLFDDFADDLLAEKIPRTLIIIGASKVDTLLYDTLSLYLLPKRSKTKEQDELLEGDRPLATFSSRIKLCYRLGIIDESLYQTIEALRELRNPSAHSVVFDIGKSPTREYIANLRNKVATRLSFQWTKNRYFNNRSINKIEELQCMLLTLCVLLEAVREKTIKTSGSKITLAISKR